MAGEVLIKAEGISKKFCRNLKRSLLYGALDMGRSMLGLRPNGTLRKDEFWAVQNINFEVRRGECLGLIGHNGAGKSTLLKMLNGLIRPDSGRIEMRGKVGALIELGAGFNPLLTGRENVYNNGAVLGISKSEIDEQFNEIVDFAEIGDFIDMPVQNYSSGMKVRLGFAVATQMNPDVLLIDEVLAVGDMGFILKCFNRIDNILRNTAVIFVSHHMPQVFRVSSSILLMEKGQTQFYGNDVSSGIDHYYSNFKTIPSFSISNEVQILSVLINGQDAFGNSKPNSFIRILRLQDLILNLKIGISEMYKNPDVSIVFYDKESKGVAEFYHEGSLIVNSTGVLNLTIDFPRILFSKGVYSITVVVRNEREGQVLLRYQSVAFFQVISELNVWTAIQLDGRLIQKF